MKNATSLISACYASKQSETISEARVEMWSKKIGHININAAPSLKTIPPITEAFT